MPTIEQLMRGMKPLTDAEAAARIESAKTTLLELIGADRQQLRRLAWELSGGRRLEEERRRQERLVLGALFGGASDE